MCPCLPVDPSRGLLLDPIVTDGGGGLQTLFEVSGAEVVSLIGGVSPYAGKAIRLKL
jgi:hypothetical protein